MDWYLERSGPPDAEAIDELGARFVSANGSLGLRATLDEFGPKERVAIILHGLYDRSGERWREPVNAPNPLHLRIACGGQALALRGASEVNGDGLGDVSGDRSGDGAIAAVASHAQGLDYRHGIQHRATEFRLADGGRVRLETRRFVSLCRESLICAETRISADQARSLDVELGIDGETWDLNGPHLRDFEAWDDGGVLRLEARSGELGVPAAVALDSRVRGALTLDTQAASIEGEDGARRIRGGYRLRLDADGEAVLERFACVAWGAGAARAAADCRAAAAQGFAALEAEHRRLWDARWEACDIEVEGDAASQEALRYSMYQLLAAAPVFGEPRSIPARGLSSQVYKGAVFWDTEIFMLPFFLNAFPGIARSLLAYRARTLPGARRKAESYGRRGAFFAWESQESGDDACTDWNVNDIVKRRPLRTFFRERQIHISADIALAVGAYWRATRDEAFLLSGGAEIVFECARFLRSWLRWNEAGDRASLPDVCGPDEYHERVDDDAWTNGAAAATFALALDLDAFLKAAHPEARQALVERLEMAAELESLPRVARALVRPSPRPSDGLIPQCEGFLELEDCGLAALLSRRLDPREYLGGQDGLARWTTVIKQADVVLALALLDQGHSARVKRANYDYYEARTEHGSSLSACAYGLLAAELGLQEDAWRYFMKSARADLDDGGKKFVGDLYIGGTHPAANGGAWIVAWRGFLGVDAGPGFLRLRPRLPAAWKGARFRIRAGSDLVQATLRRDLIRLEAVEPFEAPLAVSLPGLERSWDGSTALEQALGEALPDRPHGCIS